MNFEFDTFSGMRTGWNPQAMIMRGKLTDRQIQRYIDRGFYTADWREARRQFMASKKAGREKRQGNFVERDGRKVYSPL